MTPTLRRQVLAIVVGTALVGLWLAWSGIDSIWPPLRAMGADVPLVEYAPYDVIALPLSLTCFALAAMPLLPGAPIRTGRLPGQRDVARPWGAGLLFALAVAGLLGAAVAVPIARAVVTGVADGHGYATCPATNERHPPVRFVTAGGRCP